MYICVCNGITERELRECARSGVCSVEELAFRLGVGAGCGRCKKCVTELLREARSEQSRAGALTR